MIIAVEFTPNPRTKKFLPGRHLSPVPREFTQTARGNDPLVLNLLSLPSVQTVLVNEDAISVTIDDDKGWEKSTRLIRALIAEQLSANFLTSPDEPQSAAELDFDESDAVVVETIRDLIETRIRPSVARDGGDIVFRSYRNGVLGLEMRGACSGCPSSSSTLQLGIRNLMLHFVPEIRNVVAV